MEGMSSLQSWVAEHKLTSIGGLWASAIGASLAYTRKRSPLKPSLRLIHARMHAQALTLAVLSGAAALHYYDSKRIKVEEKEVVVRPHQHPGTAMDDEESERWSW
ncbi:respiratory supercomplex factor 2 homolog C1565.01-like [Typha latifolia]|uniref:respiratory supercomplex factor 2 homolog C1565.01-like n=1 Tax=Typha latifolia TaxID=4733 RepID=UPI003C30B733